MVTPTQPATGEESTHTETPVNTETQPAAPVVTPGEATHTEQPAAPVVTPAQPEAPVSNEATPAAPAPATSGEEEELDSNFMLDAYNTGRGNEEKPAAPTTGTENKPATPAPATPATGSEAPKPATPTNSEEEGELDENFMLDAYNSGLGD